MQAKHVLLFSIFGFLFSCQEAEIHELAFEKNFPIEGEEILPGEIGINRLYVAGDYLITAKYETDDYFFGAYDPVTLEKKGNIARKGNGPGEFPTTAKFDHAETSAGTTTIWVHDLNEQVLTGIDLQTSLRDNKTAVTELIELPAELRFAEAFYLGKSNIVGKPSNTTPQMNRLQLYDPVTESVTKTVPLFPKVEKKRDDLEFIVNKYNTLFVSGYGLRSDKTKIASAMAHFNRIDIFDAKGNLEKSILEGPEAGGQHTINDYLEAAPGDYNGLMYHYSGVFTSDRFVYALYQGILFSEYLTGTALQPKIRMFDWEGTALVELTVPEHITSLAVDEGNAWLFGVNRNQKIFRYDITHILDEL